MKRRVRTLLVFLLLLLVGGGGGAIINIAVAWALARWALPPTPAPFLYQENVVHGFTPNLHWTEPAWLPANWPAHPLGRSSESWPLFAHREFFHAEVDTQPSIAARLERARISQQHADAIEVAEANIEFSAMFIKVGWPCLALSGARFEHNVKQPAPAPAPAATSSWSQQGSTVRYALELPVPPGAPPGRVAWMQRGMLLPWHPIWPGFAINTVFYAGALWLLFAAPFALRRRSRIKRGLCPACGYDLRGSAAPICPECGKG